MKKEIYTVALIGCGQMGAVHMEQIYYKECVRLKYVCDTSLAAAEKFRRLFGAEIATTDDDVCTGDPEVDIVIIATYPTTHTALLKACVQHGKHVLCEKPLAATAADGAAFFRIASENPQCKVLVGHILRHNETYNRVAEMIQGGAIGHPIIMRMVQNHHTMVWERYRELICQTSPIIDCGVHYFDVMQWFTGEQITDISGIASSTASDLPEGKYNYGLVTVRLSGGSVGYYEAAWCNTAASENLKEFIGPRGRIKIQYRENRPSNSEEGDLIEYYRFPERTYESINVNCERKPTGAQFDYLLRMIEENVPAKPTMEEAYECFRLTLQADEKIRKR